MGDLVGVGMAFLLALVEANPDFLLLVLGVLIALSWGLAWVFLTLAR